MSRIQKPYFILSSLGRRIARTRIAAPILLRQGRSGTTARNVPSTLTEPFNCAASESFGLASFGPLFTGSQGSEAKSTKLALPYFLVESVATPLPRLSLD